LLRGKKKAKGKRDEIDHSRSFVFGGSAASDKVTWKVEKKKRDKGGRKISGKTTLLKRMGGKLEKNTSPQKKNVLRT